VIASVAQRWRARRASYRPAGEPIRPAYFDVAPIADDTTPKAFVATHHYEGTYPAARFRFGLYRRGELAGVAVFSVPVRPEVTRPLPGEALASAELGRFVLLDDVAANGESWFLARALDVLRREGLVGVVMFSDPVARTDAAGATTFLGHVGTIYQAASAIYLGKTHPDTIRLLPSGRVFASRAASKLRHRERGWRYVVEQLVAAGAPAFDGSADWSARAIAATCRKMRHSGKHKYVIPFDRAARRAVLKSLPERLDYPKFDLRGAA
jgi:hypothetical protein